MLDAYARYAANGPVRPYPEIDTMTRLGLSATRSGYAQSQASIFPGPRFSKTTSARCAKSRNVRCPAALLMSMLMLFSPRVIPA
jgi:hypothetical protein